MKLRVLEPDVKGQVFEITPEAIDLFNTLDRIRNNTRNPPWGISAARAAHKRVSHRAACIAILNTLPAANKAYRALV